MKVMSVFGTRPEAVKMCPLVRELEARKEFQNVVCLTGQHRDMVKPVLAVFGVTPDYDLDIMRPQQTLTTITADVLGRMESVLQKERPDIVLVHGDTTTSFAAALAAFYLQIPVGHVEAGLRTGDRYSPFPEEMNRRLTGRLASLHFAPTQNNRKNLEGEGIREGIYVTGNTVIDAFQTTLQDPYRFHNEVLEKQDFTKGKWILMTAHRRENWGTPLENICRAAKEIAVRMPDCRIVYPVHPNPKVRETAERILQEEERVFLTEPLDLEDMHNLMNRSYLVMTDSGGLQEEAPSCGVPVLVLRRETERPEAVAAGTVRVIGTRTVDIVTQALTLMEDRTAYDKMAKAVNPYGDGKASRRIAEALEEWDRKGRPAFRN